MAIKKSDAEVSRIMAQILGIRSAKTSSSTTVYDPTCGSGSLLLKVGDEANTPVTLYGQVKDGQTSGLARMNMILHNNPTATIARGNTLSSPKFLDSDALKIFDYVVANPPFSDKRWTTGLDPLNDPHERFKSFGVPPGKQGDYAYLLHIVRSLKSTGTGACILPHGVLFRGNAETDIRRNLIRTISTSTYRATSTAASRKIFTTSPGTSKGAFRLSMSIRSSRIGMFAQGCENRSSRRTEKATSISSPTRSTSRRLSRHRSLRLRKFGTRNSAGPERNHRRNEGDTPPDLLLAMMCGSWMSIICREHNIA